MRESTRALLLFGTIIVVGIVTYVYFFRPFMEEQPAVQQVINANSVWSVTMQEYLMHGPVSAETYRISNDNGKTTIFYSATNRAGTETKEFKVPLAGPSGTFLFEQLRADGLWELDDRPVRPNPVDEYVIEVDQTLGDEGGTHAFSFSDPAYWASTHSQEFDLHLPAKGPISGNRGATFGVAGKSLREPRYWKIVQEIRAFGTPSILSAQATIRRQLAQTLAHPIPPR
jgi:hypothetical protein